MAIELKFKSTDVTKRMNLGALTFTEGNPVHEVDEAVAEKAVEDFPQYFVLAGKKVVKKEVKEETYENKMVGGAPETKEEPAVETVEKEAPAPLKASKKRSKKRRK
jgi:hypothetical protein